MTEMLLSEYLEQTETGRCEIDVICNIAKQLLEQLRDFHENERLVYGISSSNVTIVMVKNKKKNKIKLYTQLEPQIRVMKSFWNFDEDCHIQYRERVDRRINLLFAGLAAHFGIEVSRRDDLQSLAYLLIWLAKGDLPWSRAVYSTTKGRKSRRDTVENIKIHTNESLCDGLPQILKDFFAYCDNLHFDERPNYNHFIDKFSSELNDHYNLLMELIMINSSLPKVLGEIIVSYTMFI